MRVVGLEFFTEVLELTLCILHCLKPQSLYVLLLLQMHSFCVYVNELLTQRTAELANKPGEGALPM